MDETVFDEINHNHGRRAVFLYPFKGSFGVCRIQSSTVKRSCRRSTVDEKSTKIPRGKGRLTITKDNTVQKRCIITIKNTDTLCLARAIVMAHANSNKGMWTKSQIKNGFNKSMGLQKTMALKLHENAGVGISGHGNTLEDVDTFAKHLGIQINIVDADYFNDIIHTANPDATEMIYIYKNKNHDVITSMPAFLGKDYYCHTCKKSYKCRDKHRCPLKCLACFKTEHHSGGKITCGECNRVFFGQKCYGEHLRDRSKGKKLDVVCELVQKCLKCKRTLSDLTVCVVTVNSIVTQKRTNVTCYP